MINDIDDPTFRAKLAEIRRLLAEATEHALAIDGHCKSSEGAISIEYPPFFWREEKPKPPAVTVYSYVLGPNRDHYFDDIDEALAAVKSWHEKEMCHAEYDVNSECTCSPASEDYWGTSDPDLKAR